MKILIADDHPLYREAAATRIGRLYPNATIEEVSFLDDLFEIAGRDKGGVYDLFLLDFHMPGMSQGALRKLNVAFPLTPIAIMSGTAENAEVREVIAAGARGFIPKTATADQFASAIGLLLAGGTSVPAEILQSPSASAESANNAAAPWLALLSPREVQVLKGAARGISNKQIARELNLAEVTVKLHLRSVFRKTGVRNRAEAAVLATKAGIA